MIAQALGAQAFGDLDIVVARAAEPSMAGPDDLALAMQPAYGAALAQGQARVAVVWPDADWQALGLQATDNKKSIVSSDNLDFSVKRSKGFKYDR
jgi:UDP-3-O-[3-hydroxymyristoyl] glucosamine N-acyltransferase